MRRTSGLLTASVMFLSSIAPCSSSAQASATGTLTGRALVDTIMRPIEGVEVSIPALSRSTTSDEKGAFRIGDIPAGRHMVIARKIGYARYEAVLDIDPGETVDRRVVLPRVAALDTVRVVGDPSLPLSFIDHRAVGLGHFMTRDELAKNNSRKLSDVVSQIPGLGVISSRRNEGWAVSKRYPLPIRTSIRVYPGQRSRNNPGEDIYTPDDFEKARGMKAGCYARVYLDGTLLNSTTPAEPVDINLFPPDGLEAIEYYSGPSQTPMQYARLNSNCGVLVLHTRRTK